MALMARVSLVEFSSTRNGDTGSGMGWVLCRIIASEQSHLSVCLAILSCNPRSSMLLYLSGPSTIFVLLYIAPDHRPAPLNSRFPSDIINVAISLYLYSSIFIRCGTAYETISTAGYYGALATLLLIN